MLKSRKALEWSVIISIIVMAIILLVILPLYSELKAASNEAALNTACIQSLDTIKKARVIGGKLSDSIGHEKVIKCTTQYPKINSEGESLARDFADYIYRCYTIYGKRDYLFDQSTGTYCIICSSIKVTSGAGKIEGLVDTLKTKGAPIKGGATYEMAFGGQDSIPKGAKAVYDSYTLPAAGKSTAVIATFGTSGFKGEHLVFISDTKIGFLLHPYDDVANLGCYSFEGATTSLHLLNP